VRLCECACASVCFHTYVCVQVYGALLLCKNNSRDQSHVLLLLARLGPRNIYVNILTVVLTHPECPPTSHPGLSCCSSFVGENWIRLHTGMAPQRPKFGFAWEGRLLYLSPYLAAGIGWDFSNKFNLVPRGFSALSGEYQQNSIVESDAWCIKIAEKCHLWDILNFWSLFEGKIRRMLSLNN